MSDQNFDRFRSFAERYIIARAGFFRPGFEREDAWKATLDAKTVYGNVARMSIDAEPLELEIAKMVANNKAGTATQAGVGSSIGQTGTTGPMHPRLMAAKPAPPPVHGLMQNIQSLIRKVDKYGTP